MKYILTLCLICVLMGCAGILENWKRDPETGKMVLQQRLKAKGLGDLKGKFEDKSTIDREAYKPIPQLPIKDVTIGGD